RRQHWPGELRGVEGGSDRPDANAGARGGALWDSRELCRARRHRDPHDCRYPGADPRAGAESHSLEALRAAGGDRGGARGPGLGRRLVHHGTGDLCGRRGDGGRLTPGSPPGSPEKQEAIMLRALGILTATLALLASGAPSTLPPAVAAPGAAAPPAAAPAAQALDPISIGVLGILSDAPFILARERGYFAEQRLAADFQTFDSGARMVPVLATGQLDVAPGSPSVGLYNAISR